MRPQSFQFGNLIHENPPAISDPAAVIKPGTEREKNRSITSTLQNAYELSLL